MSSRVEYDTPRFEFACLEGKDRQHPARSKSPD